MKPDVNLELALTHSNGLLGEPEFTGFSEEWRVSIALLTRLGLTPAPAPRLRFQQELYQDT